MNRTEEQARTAAFRLMSTLNQGAMVNFQDADVSRTAEVVGELWTDPADRRQKVTLAMRDNLAATWDVSLDELADGFAKIELV